DEQLRPMSKSLGNVVSPLDVIKELGADVLRLWVASEEYRCDVSVSIGLLQQVGGVYRRIRNTIRFLLGNVSDFNPARDAVGYADMEEDDRWILAALTDVQEKVRRAYDSYEFHRVYHLLNGFCVSELGAIYLDCSKDRLYCDLQNGRVRRACQTAMHELVSRMLRMLAPVLPFTCDEAWSHLPDYPGKAPSVHLTDFPAPADDWQNPELLAKWQRLLALRSEVQKAIEPLRAKENKVIGNSLEAAVTLTSDDAATLGFLRAEQAGFARLFIVSRVDLIEGAPAAPAGGLETAGLKLAISVSRSNDPKCERCWVYSPTVGEDSLHPTLCARCSTVVRSQTT
ncbi:class I tRNA ligase family protein, partial [Candidatus Poribacteria bacterium]|nr:class I tRNA ligase family protein [Candidatus Poribacteria bacterium]